MQVVEVEGPSDVATRVIQHAGVASMQAGWRVDHQMDHSRESRFKQGPLGTWKYSTLKGKTWDAFEKKKTYAFMQVVQIEGLRG